MPHKHPKHEHKPHESQHIEKVKSHTSARSVVFLPIGNINVASSRLICYENAGYLRKLGWRAETIRRGNYDNYDILVFQRRHGSRDLVRAKAAKGKDSMDDPDSVALSRLLRVSLGDPMLIERRYEGDMTVKLDARFIIENGYKSEPDWPHEFERRIVRVKFRESDKLKDTDILTDIFKEMPGILNWALEGLVRLRKAGHFTKLKK